MQELPNVFRMASAMARHASARQAMIATNIANADTPGYAARQIPDFAATWSDSSVGLRVTRTGHMAAEAAGRPQRPVDSAGEPSPNGNNVSIEAEMFAAVDAQREHGRALAIWRHGLGLLRTSLGRQG